MVFDADRDAHQAVADAVAVELVGDISEWVVVRGWQASVSTPPRLTALRAMRSRRRKSKAARAPPLARARTPRPGKRHCASRMRICSGSVNSARVVARRAPWGARPSCGTMRAAFLLWRDHAQLDRGQAAVEDPALVGLQDVAEDGAHAAQAGDQRRVAAHHHARQHVAVAGQVLGGRIDAQIGAERQRVLEDRAEEGVVDRDQRARRRCAPRPAATAAAMSVMTRWGWRASR